MANKNYQQTQADLLHGQIMGIAYSGFRQGQHPDRGNGSNNPGDAEILEDLNILIEHGFSLIRLYDADQNSQDTLRIIDQHNLPIKVLLGIWLEAEVSNHEGCPWLHDPIPADKLADNTLKNQREVTRAISLARQYRNIIIAINVGNEALVAWNDHMVTLDAIIAYVREVKASVDQPVTVADNCDWWIKEGAPLAAEVDFLGIHTYAVWEHKPIEEGLSYTIQNLEDVHTAFPDKQLAILEAGWATTASEFVGQANQHNQARYYSEIEKWARETHTTVLFFEAFDEPWKGSPNHPDGAEKHWGIFFVDRSPKQIARQILSAQQQS